MIRVTKAEVKEAPRERGMVKEYCICRNCHYAFRITDEERKGYQDLRCGNCSTEDFYYTGHDVGLVDSIIDPEPTKTCERVPDSVTNEEIVKDFHSLDRIYIVCGICGAVYKYNYDSTFDYGYSCPNCHKNCGYYAVGVSWLKKYRKPIQPQEQYCVFVEGHNLSVSFDTLDVANSEADWRAALPNNIGEKVLVLKVINTRIATSKIEYERS